MTGVFCLLVVGCWLLVVGCWLLVVGFYTNSSYVAFYSPCAKRTLREQAPKPLALQTKPAKAG
jgi:hypothetical protein